MMKNAMEYSDLTNYVNSMKKNLSEKNIENFFNNTSKIIAQELYDELWKRTPVITGFLRHGWNVGLGMKYQNARFYPKNPVHFPRVSHGELYNTVNINIEKIVPDKDGNKYTVYFSNPVYYAPFVEYGHKITVHGRKAPKGKVKLFANDIYVQPYKEGHHMMGKSVEEVNENLTKIVSKELNKLITGK